MADFDPLVWELQFKLQNQGADLVRAQSLLQNVANVVSVTNITIINMNKALNETSKNVNNNSGFAKIAKQALSAISGVSAVISYLKRAYTEFDSFTEKAVSSFAERQASLRAYTSILGSATEAEKQYFKEAALSQKTELTQTDVRGFSSRLITSGFRGDNLERARLNVADLVSSRPEHLRAASSNQLAELYSKVRGLGYIQEGLVNRTASRFVSGNFIREEIGKQLNIKPSEVQGALKDRKVSADAFFNAFQAASLRQLGTKKTGEFALGGNNTLSGLLSNQGEAEENLYRSINPDTLAGVKLYKESIIELTSAMDSSTKTGDNLRYVLESVSDVGTGLRAAGNDFKTGFLEDFASGFRDTEEKLGTSSEETKVSLELLGDNFRELGRLFGGVVGPAAAYVIKSVKGLGIAWDILAIGVKAAGRTISNFGITVKDGFADLLEYVSQFFDLAGKLIVGSYKKILGTVTFNSSLKNEGNEILKNLGFDQSKFSKDRTDKATFNSDLDELFKTLIEKERDEKENIALAKEREKKKKGALPLPSDTESGGIGRGGGGRKGRGGGGDSSGVLLAFDYQNALPSIALGSAASVGSGGVFNVTPPDLKFSSGRSSAIHIDTIEIIIEGANSSPEEIADQVYTRFSQSVGRLVRAPSVGVI